MKEVEEEERNAVKLGLGLEVGLAASNQKNQNSIERDSR